MSPKSRRYLILLVGILGLGYFFYKFRNAITLEGFRWSVVGESLRHANIPLLITAVLTTYVCFAIRALRWMRFSRAIGETRLRKRVPGDAHGFRVHIFVGPRGRAGAPCSIGRKDSLPIPQMFGVYVLERVFDMAAAIVLAGAALILFEQRGLTSGHDTPIMRVARSAGFALLVGRWGLWRS